MTNGSNSYGVTLPQINFITKLLTTHANVASFERSHDIQFDIVTKRGRNLRLVCVDEYTCGLGRVLEVLDDFPGTQIVYVGGAWNGYTWEAKEYCLQANLGLFNSTEINGALHRDDYWTYSKKDRKGNPIYPTKAS